MLLFMWTGLNLTTTILNFKLLQTIFKNKGGIKILIFHLMKKKRLKLRTQKLKSKEEEAVQRKWLFKTSLIQKKKLDFQRWKRLDTIWDRADRKWKESEDNRKDPKLLRLQTNKILKAMTMMKRKYKVMIQSHQVGLSERFETELSGKRKTNKARI